MWDVDLAVAEVNRLGKKDCRSISFLEAPHAFGLPSFLSGHWDPMLAALCDNKITWENACRFFDWDPFAHTSRDDATVGALRTRAADVDTSRMPRAEWRKRNEAAGIGRV